tara:strand:- start:212 stop:385 length:174 start_codon:yes stop_codon:yes gene_type:complete
MNLNSETNNFESDGQNLNAPIIKISHYEDDKLLKTETYPVVHFLDFNSHQFKKVNYS